MHLNLLCTWGCLHFFKFFIINSLTLIQLALDASLVTLGYVQTYLLLDAI